jgi:hypothetical protein
MWTHSTKMLDKVLPAFKRKPANGGNRLAGS